MTDGGWFAAWIVVGCALALGTVSLGPLVLLPVAVLLFVAYVNREGPGTTCWERGTASGCDGHLNPLPWLLLGVAFVVGGFVAHRLRRH